MYVAGQDAVLLNFVACYRLSLPVRRLLVPAVSAGVVVVRVTQSHSLVHRVHHVDLGVEFLPSRTVSERVPDSRVDSRSALLLVETLVPACESVGVLGWIEVIQVLWGPINVISLGRKYLGGGFGVAEDLVHLHLLDLLERGVLDGFGLARSGNGKDHIFDQISDALAISVIEDFADDALQEHFLLELNLLVLLSPAFLFGSIAPSTRVVLPALWLRFPQDETVQIRR